MITTDNALDLAIDGDGFFEVLKARWHHGIHTKPGHSRAQPQVL